MKTTDDKQISLISKDISYIQIDINEIKGSIKSLVTVFASKEELATIAKDTEKRLCSLESKASGWGRFIVPAITGVVCSVVTFLVISYLQSGRV
jgi:hypothetical protein